MHLERSRRIRNEVFPQKGVETVSSNIMPFGQKNSNSKKQQQQKNKTVGVLVLSSQLVVQNLLSINQIDGTLDRLWHYNLQIYHS